MNFESFLTTGCSSLNFVDFSFFSSFTSHSMTGFGSWFICANFDIHITFKPICYTFPYHPLGRLVELPSDDSPHPGRFLVTPDHPWTPPLSQYIPLCPSQYLWTLLLEVERVSSICSSVARGLVTPTLDELDPFSPTYHRKPTAARSPFCRSFTFHPIYPSNSSRLSLLIFFTLISTLQNLCGLLRGSLNELIGTQTNQYRFRGINFDGYEAYRIIWKLEWWYTSIPSSFCWYPH